MSSNFRQSFRILHKEVLHWFPGHMGKGLRQMQQKLKNVDCIIEVIHRNFYLFIWKKIQITSWAGTQEIKY